MHYAPCSWYTDLVDVVLYIRLCRIFVRVRSKFIVRPSYAYEQRAQTRVGAYIYNVYSTYTSYKILSCVPIQYIFKYVHVVHRVF